MNHAIKSLLVVSSFMLVAYTWPWEAPAAKNKQALPDVSNQQEKLPAPPAKAEQIVFPDTPVGLNPLPVPQIVTLDKLTPNVSTLVPKPLVNDNLLNSLSADQQIKTITNPMASNPVPKLPVAQPNVTPDVHNVENQIQDIIALNRGIKQTQEVQRIVEQAQIHQRLLTGLANPPVTKVPVSATDADEMLRQEKIRVISQETEKNRKIIEDIRQSGQ